MSRRAFVVVLDACGAGELPDAAAYGDAGANTLGHLASAVGGLRLPALERLGLGSVQRETPADRWAAASRPPAPLRTLRRAMPELPEVETVRRQVAPRAEGRRIAELEVLDERWSAPRSAAEISDAVRGRRIERVGRRGKYLSWT
ncbi:MAG TPA: DNA-formamidopyrimidine glycosylase family protein, partial [Solirubrobacteraceae bacterium]